MNTPLIIMDEGEAKAKFRAYKERIAKLERSKAAKAVTEEYKQILAGYKALGKGIPLIDLDDAIASGGFDAQGRPRIAICAAHRKIVEFEWRNASQALFRPSDTGNSQWRTIEKEQRLVMLKRPASALAKQGEYGPIYYSGYARVPLVPADVRPNTGSEDDWYILWEVEQWKSRNEVIPDRDPYLLKHLGGSLYAVLAEWDLTDLERSVMKQANIGR